MEENLRALNSFRGYQIMTFIGETLSFLSSDPLFSTIITFYTLILLYFPSLFLHFIFSPVLISTAILLLSLLRLGAAQNSMPRETAKTRDLVNYSQAPSQHIDQDFIDHHRMWISCVSDNEPKREFVSEPSSNPFYADYFVEWDVRAPLEVIYEEYEGEEGEENDGVSHEKRESQMNIIQRYASLSLFYPESDTDNSSEGDSTAIVDWDSPANACFRWEEEYDRDGLIEIALDEKRNNEVDEDNLIEIDLSPAR